MEPFLYPLILGIGMMLAFPLTVAATSWKGIGITRLSPQFLTLLLWGHAGGILLAVLVAPLTLVVSLIW